MELLELEVDVELEDEVEVEDVVEDLPKVRAAYPPITIMIISMTTIPIEAVLLIACFTFERADDLMNVLLDPANLTVYEIV